MNRVPVTWEASTILVKVLSQIESVRSVFDRSGVGNMVKTISVESPAHPLANGRIRYVTVCVEYPVLSIRWLIRLVPVNWLEKPVRLGLLAKALQVKVVPITFVVRVIVARVLSQMELARMRLERSGVGNTVTTISMESPGQLFAFGRILYVTVCVVKPVLSILWFNKVVPVAWFE